MLVSKRIIVIFALLLVTIGVAACSAPPTDVQAPTQDFVLKLPRLVVDIDANGVPTFAGLSAETLKNVTYGQLDLTWMRMDPAVVKRFMDIGLQHVELLQNDSGLYLFVNGEPLPNIAWSPESLKATSGAINTWGGLDPALVKMIDMMLPYLQSVGLDLAVRFPIAQGAEAVPMRDVNSPLPAPSTAAGETGGLALRVEVIYDKNGQPSVPGASFILKNLLGIDVAQLALNKPTIDILAARGISSITLNTRPDGIEISVNEETLPKLVWSENQLRTTLQVLGDFYLGAATASLTQVIENIIPALNELDLQLVLTFPSG